MRSTLALFIAVLLAIPLWCAILITSRTAHAQQPPGTGGCIIINGSTGVATNMCGFILQGFAVSGLPACTAPRLGMQAYVTDASSPTYNGTLTGGSTTKVPVFCNGTAWTAH